MAKAKIHEPPHLVADLKRMHLTSMASEWQRLAEEARSKRQPHAEYLADLAHLEVSGRLERRIQRRIKDARFPMLKTLDAFDFEAPHGLDREEVLELFDCSFVAQATNVVLLGGVGTGKTHIEIALGMACCQNDYRVRFTTAAELTNMLVEAKSQDRLSRKLEQLARLDLVIIDELGYVPFASWSEVFLDHTAAAPSSTASCITPRCSTPRATATGSATPPASAAANPERRSANPQAVETAVSVDIASRCLPPLPETLACRAVSAASTTITQESLFDPRRINDRQLFGRIGHGPSTECEIPLCSCVT